MNAEDFQKQELLIEIRTPYREAVFGDPKEIIAELMLRVKQEVEEKKIDVQRIHPPLLTMEPDELVVRVYKRDEKKEQQEKNKREWAEYQRLKKKFELINHTQVASMKDDWDRQHLGSFQRGDWEGDTLAVIKGDE